MAGKLWPMELCTKIEEHNRKMIDTEMDVTTSNGPADWFQKEIRDSLAMTKALLPDVMKKEMCESVKDDLFIDEMKVWKKRDILDALTDVSTAATTAAKNLNNAAFSLEARKLCEKRREEMERNKKEKENNMFSDKKFEYDAQRYYDSIKNYLRVSGMNITQRPGNFVEIEITGNVMHDQLNNTNKKEYDKMYKNAPKMPKPTGIIRRDNTTRVDWDDKTYTIIVLEEGKEDLDMFHTFCIAFTKKMFGSTTNIMKAIEENDTDTIERERAEAIKKAEQEAAEEARKEREEMERKQFEEDVRLEMYDHRVREEAIRRIMAQDEKEKLAKEFLEKYPNLPSSEE